MSTFRVLPEARSADAALFLSAAGALTRAEIEEDARRRRLALLDQLRSAGPASLASHHRPPLLLLDLLAVWSLGGLLVLEAGGRHARCDRAPAAELDPGALLLPAPQELALLYTSGTTGQPERHVKSARQLLGEAEVLGPLLGLGPGSVVLSTVSLHHLYGLLFGLLAPIKAGASVVSDEASDPSHFHPHRVAEAVREYGVTHLVTIPAHVRSLLDAAVPLHGVAEVVSSAAALPPAWAAELEQRSGARVLDVLGSTETGGVALRRTAREPSYRPFPGVSVRAGAEGLMEVRSALAGEEPVHTGDRIELLDDGTFRHLGRDDGVIKIAGKRFSLQELEAGARDVPGVTDAVAFVRPKEDARGNEVWLVACGSALDRAQLRAELGRRIDPVLMPRRLRILERLPRDARGKVPRALLERCLSLTGFDLLDCSVSPFRIELRLRADSPRLSGHFPGAPVLPAVAQLLDLVVPEVERLARTNVVEARRLKWLSPILPGQRIVLTIDRADEGGGTPTGDYRFRFAAPEGTILSSGILSTELKDPR